MILVTQSWARGERRRFRLPRMDVLRL